MKKILLLFVTPALFAASPQYQSGEIIVPAASAQETVLKQFSLEKADQYVQVVQLESKINIIITKRYWIHNEKFIYRSYSS